MAGASPAGISQCPFFAGASPRRTTIALLASAFIRHAALAFGRCIYSPRRPLAFGQRIHLSRRLAFGRRIDSPRRPLASGLCIHSPRRPCFRPAYLFAVPIAIFRRRIPSPCHHRHFSPAHHPIAMPPSPISVGASHRRTALSYFTSCAETATGFRFRDHRKSWCISSPHLHRLSRFAIWPAQSARLPRRNESPPLGWCTRS